MGELRRMAQAEERAGEAVLLAEAEGAKQIAASESNSHSTTSIRSYLLAEE